MKILDINENPLIRVYTHHLYINAILSGKEKTGDKRAEIEILSNNIGILNIKKQNSNIEVKNNFINLFANLYEKSTNTILYKECDDIDELTIKVTYQQYVQPWALVDIFIKEFDKVNNDNFDCLIGRFCNNQVLTINQYKKKFINYDGKQKYPYWLKICRENDKIDSYYSTDGSNWDIFSSSNINDSSKSNKRIIGIEINLEDNHYYNWLFTNHIHLMANETASLPLEYLITPFNGYNYITYNPLMNVIPERIKFIKNNYNTVIDYIEFCISNDRYIMLWLDEYYIENRKAFANTHFNHQNLIYGYDDDHIYLLGIYMGKSSISKVKKNEFIKSYNVCENANNIIYLFDYQPDSYKFEFNLNQLKSSIYDYLNGNIQNVGFYNIPEFQNYSFGINIYDKFTNERGINIFIDDVRIAYLIYEHKICMRERIKFLIKRNIIKFEECTEIIADIDEMCHKSNILINIIIKNSIKKSHIKEKVINYLNDIKNIEIKCYSLLYNKL